MSIIEDPRECKGMHRYFVACDGTVIGIHGGKVCVVIVCTACGESKLIEHSVTGDNFQFQNKGK